MKDTLINKLLVFQKYIIQSVIIPLLNLFFASVNYLIHEAILALNPTAENQLAAAGRHDGHLVDVVAATAAQNSAIISTLTNTISRSYP